MTPELKTLMKILSCVNANGDQHTHFIIDEKDINAKLKKIRLQTNNGDWFVFRPEIGQGKPKKMSPLLSTGHDLNHHRACDAVILTKKNNELCIIFIELKSNNPKGFINQFKSTRCFFHYLLDIAKVFHNTTFPIIREKFIVFYTTQSGSLTLAKRPTVLKKNITLSEDIEHPSKENVNNNSVLFFESFV